MGASKEYSAFKVLRDNYMYDLVKNNPFLTVSDLMRMFNLQEGTIREILKGKDKNLKLNLKPSIKEDTEYRQYQIQYLIYNTFFDLKNRLYGYDTIMEVMGIRDLESMYQFHISALEFANSYKDNQYKNLNKKFEEGKIQYNNLLSKYNQTKSKQPLQVKEVVVEDKETIEKLASKYKELKTKYESLLANTNIYATNEQTEKIKFYEHENTILNSSLKDLKELNKKITDKNTDLMHERTNLIDENSKYKGEIENLESKLSLAEAREESLNKILDDKSTEYKSLSLDFKKILTERDNYKSLYEESLKLVSDLKQNLDDLNFNNVSLDFDLSESENALKSCKDELEKTKEEVKKLTEKKQKKKSFSSRLSSEEKDLIVSWWTSHRKRLTKKSLDEFNSTYHMSVSDSTFRYVVDEWPERKKELERKENKASTKKRKSKSKSSKG